LSVFVFDGVLTLVKIHNLLISSNCPGPYIGEKW